MQKKINADSERIKKLKEKFQNNSEITEDILTEKKDKTFNVIEGIKEQIEDEHTQILEENNPYILMGQNNFDKAIIKFEELLKQPSFQDRKTKEEILDIVIKLCRFINDPGRENKYKTWKNLFVWQDKINEFTEEFLNKRKNLRLQKSENLLKNLEDIEQYFIKEKLVASGHQEARDLFDLFQAYAISLDTTGHDALALQYYEKLLKLNPKDNSTYFFIFNYYLERSVDQDENYEKAKETLQNLLDIVNRENNPEKAQDLLIDIKEQYWQLCRKNNRHERAMKIVEDEFLNNDLLYLLAHFRFGLKFGRDVLQKTTFVAQKELTAVITEVRKMIKAGGIKVENNLYLPEHYQLYNLTEIWLDSEINKNNKNVLGHLYVKEGELEDINNQRFIRVYTEGLTDAEVFQVVLHEIGHNAYFLLSEQEKDLWAKMCENFNLTAAYRGQKYPVLEAFADYYANFVLFNKLWHEMIKDEEFDQPRVIYNYFRNIFKLDKDQVLAGSANFAEDIKNYRYTIKKTIHDFVVLQQKPA